MKDEQALADYKATAGLHAEDTGRSLCKRNLGPCHQSSKGLMQTAPVRHALLSHGQHWLQFYTQKAAAVLLQLGVVGSVHSEQAMEVDPKSKVGKLQLSAPMYG